MADISKINVNNTDYDIKDAVARGGISNLTDIEKSASGSIASFDNGGDNIPVKSLVVYITAVQAGEGTPSPSNPRAISGYTDVVIKNDVQGTTQATYTIALGSTVYGGTLDVTKGILTITHGIADLGDLTWEYSSENVAFYNTTRMSDCAVDPTTCLCSSYEFDANANSTSVTSIARKLSNLQMAAYSNAVNSGRVVVKDSNYTDANTFKTAVTGQKLTYPLATPVVINLTKTQVTTLLNENNIYANSGYISVRYFTQSAKNILDVADSSNKMDFSNPTGTGALSLNRASGTTVAVNSVAEGTRCEASGNQSHAEGYQTVASISAAHAEGQQTQATARASHAEGYDTEASGIASHAENHGAKASGAYSHAEGLFTEANHRSQHTFGEYNLADTNTAASSTRGTYIEIVGKGTSNANRSNARTLDWSGNETLAGGLKLHTDKDAATLTVSSSIAAGATYNFASYSDGTVIFVYRPSDAGQSDYTGIYIRAENWQRLIPIKVAPNVTINGYVLTNGNSQVLRCAIIST